MRHVLLLAPPQSCVGGALGVGRPMRLEDEMGLDLGLDSPALALPQRGSARQVVRVQSWAPHLLRLPPRELEPRSEDQSVADSHRINYSFLMTPGILVSTSRHQEEHRDLCL